MLGKTKRNLSPTEKRFFYLCAFTIALLLTSILPQSTVARTWYIKADGTGDAPTIQAGVDSAAVGDTVLVGPGTYTDTTHVVIAGNDNAVNVNIHKQVTILGDPSASRPILGDASSDVGIFLDGVQTARIAGLTVKRYDTSGGTSSRIWCRSSTVSISQVEVIGDHHGLFLWDSIAKVSDSDFRVLSAGVVVSGGSHVDIYNNRISDCYTGVYGENSVVVLSHNTIGGQSPGMEMGVYSDNDSICVVGNTIRWCESGIVGNGSEMNLDGNMFLYDGHGIELSNASATVKNNVFSHARWGIWTWSGTGEISNNTLDDCSSGIVSEFGSDFTIRRNIISRGFWGIQCNGAQLSVECNDIFDMSSGIYDWLCIGEPASSNFSLDPEYCGIDDSGNYYLQSDSPCIPGNHPQGNDCGLIGALPIHCGDVPAGQATWGSIKSLFKNGGDK